jgi:DNA/RNA endonuclease YhcR with UshA esterase domain
MNEGLRKFYGKLEIKSNQINVSTKYGTVPTENDIIAQWDQDILVSTYFKKYC